MKTIEKDKARELRKQGLAIKEIAKQLGVAKSSVSVWVRDIELTEEQKEKLQQQNPIFNAQLIGSRVKQENMKAKRIRFQEEGRQRAKTDSFYVAGCMLYWAEGTKDKNSIRLTNSDANMIKFFVNWAKKCFDLDDNEFRIQIHCYDDMYSVDEIERYWLDELELPRECLTKTMVNHYSKYSSQKRCGKIPYGTCKIMVHKTELIQGIYGAIQEYTGYDHPEWLN